MGLDFFLESFCCAFGGEDSSSLLLIGGAMMSVWSWFAVFLRFNVLDVNRGSDLEAGSTGAGRWRGGDEASGATGTSLVSSFRFLLTELRN